MSITNTVSLYFADRRDFWLDVTDSDIRITIPDPDCVDGITLGNMFHLVSKPEKCSEFNSVSGAIQLIESEISNAAGTRADLYSMIEEGVY